MDYIGTTHRAEIHGSSPVRRQSQPDAGFQKPAQLKTMRFDQPQYMPQQQQLLAQPFLFPVRLTPWEEISQDFVQHCLECKNDPVPPVGNEVALDEMAPAVTEKDPMTVVEARVWVLEKIIRGKPLPSTAIREPEQKESVESRRMNVLYEKLDQVAVRMEHYIDELDVSDGRKVDKKMGRRSENSNSLDEMIGRCNTKIANIQAIMNGMEESEDLGIPTQDLERKETSRYCVIP